MTERMNTIILNAINPSVNGMAASVRPFAVVESGYVCPPVCLTVY